MRLAAFKARGFKSFAEPVSFKVGGELTAVVGPNGCGKSNIVDAVRWVLGESRASSLRGTTLSDVMFNGSEKRQPADWCYVELRFVNENGDSGGMWAAYPEIIVRRELSRDGGQSYTINGNAARRRDVVDLFRGTGVAPRAYGVIEQGMVTDIAEASPEELRAFMEEAAGVSHYKERRRDSERRLAASSDNLAQLALMADGLAKRAESLKRQARAANRYRALGEEINRLDARLILSRREAVRQELAVISAGLRESEQTISALQAEQSALKQQSDRQKETRAALQAETDKTQRSLSEAQKALTKSENDMQNIQQGKSAAKSRREEAQQEADALLAQAQQLEKEGESTQAQHAAAVEAASSHAGAADAEASELARLQVGREAAQSEVDSAREHLTAAQQALHASTLRRQMLEERLADLDKRAAKARQANDELPPDEEVIADTAAEEEALAAAEQALDAARARRDAQRGSLEETDADARRLENELAALTAQIDTLNAMLKEDSWQGAGERLAHKLQVEAGEWSRALDAALGVYAGAVAVQDLTPFLAAGALPPAGAAIVETQPAGAAPPANNTGLPPLLDKLQAPAQSRQALAYWLADVYAAQDEEEAAAARARLAGAQRIVTRAGAVIGAHSLLVTGEARGGYDWEQRMRDLSQSRQRGAAALEEARQTRGAAAAALQTMQKEIQQRAQRQSEAQQQLADKRIEQHRRQERQATLRARREELAQLMESLQNDKAQADGEHSALAAALEDLQKAHQTRAAEFERCRDILDSAGAALENYRAQLQEAGLKRRDTEREAEELKRRLNDIAARLRELESQRAQRLRRVQEFEGEMQRHDEDSLRQALADAQARLAACEEQAAARRGQQAEAEAAIARLEEQREQKRAQAEKAQQQAADGRLSERELTLKVEYLNDSLEELGLSEAQMEEISGAPADGADEPSQAAIDELRAKRDRMGAINFMADSELRECESRLSEIDAQKTDAENAIAELKSTIARIDTETKTRLQTMFDAVNKEFSVLYKQIFGGGEAYLEMAGEAILDSGFELKVRPPGKRLFPVRMLSGGEKAASAAAFIFSILRLNPPPFCILDEVDAPLDENRSQRFVEMLQDISQTVQCLVVSHNKGTIAAMPRLIGVTQEEPGISKIVSVSLSAALQNAGR